MVKTALTTREQCEVLLDKIDADLELSTEEKWFYYRNVHSYDDNKIQFILNGCDIPDGEKPEDKNIAYII